MQAQKAMYDDCPWIFMFSADNIAAASKRVKGIAVNPNPAVLRTDTAYFEG
jgi:ABC-type transport system substrate-binding protein